MKLSRRDTIRGWTYILVVLSIGIGAGWLIREFSLNRDQFIQRAAVKGFIHFEVDSSGSPVPVWNNEHVRYVIEGGDE